VTMNTKTYIPFPQETLNKKQSSNKARALKSSKIAAQPVESVAMATAPTKPYVSYTSPNTETAQPVQDSRQTEFDRVYQESLNRLRNGESSELPTNSVLNPPIHGFNRATSDAEGLSLALPSRFAFYSFKDLYIVPFKAKHLAKLQAAHSQRSMLPVIEAVSSVIYSTEYNKPGLAFELTLPDFYFVLYWLRLNSFTKSNFTHETKCNNPEHHAKVEQGLLPKESLEIRQIIRNTELKTVELEHIPDPEIFKFSETSPFMFNPPRMSDVMEFVENPKMKNAALRDEFAFMAQLATHIQGKHKYLNLEERISFFEEASGDVVQQVQEYESLIENYGVQETIQVTCKECGHQRVTKLTLDAWSFLQHGNF